MNTSPLSLKFTTSIRALIPPFPLRNQARPVMRGGAFLLIAALVLPMLAAQGDFSNWLEQVRMVEAEVNTAGICAGKIGELPGFTVTPETPGRHLVRVSVPFAPGALPVELGVVATCDEASVAADVRALTRHPGMPVSIRRAMITFPFDFPDAAPHHFTLTLADAPPADTLLTSVEEIDSGFALHTSLGIFHMTADSIRCADANEERWAARLIAPEATSNAMPDIEIVEQGAHYMWVRLLAPDEAWPRIMELRVDSTGGVAIQAHIQRLFPGNDTAPDLGWQITGLEPQDMDAHRFDGEAITPYVVHTKDRLLRFPRAHMERRGYVAAEDGAVVFLRCETSEQVAFQETAWRSAAFCIDPVAAPERTPLLEYAMNITLPPDAFDAIYGCGLPPRLTQSPPIENVQQYTRDALLRAVALGDDFGNVTSYGHNSEQGPVYGMNRLNHCPAIFMEAWRSGERQLRDAATLWCFNMHDLSLWWGRSKGFGGTRYNNAAAAGEEEHANDPHFMWRTNYASNFCTKGFDSFFLAYEETGDPRMLSALNAQVAYARHNVHVNRGEARNIGDVADFMTLYRYTQLPMYLEEAMRLFRELRECLGDDHLFSQSGKPVIHEVPFIDDDARGYDTPFGKPYIMGYALAGLPDLLTVTPNEERLADTVRAVAQFQAGAQDPLGGWRYPHPNSSWMIIDQGMEHSVQLARAADVLHSRGESITLYLDAIERALQARIQGFRVSGTILSGLGGWERAAGIPEDKSIYDLYSTPEDRDPTRDYAEGNISSGGASPEGLAHFFEALNFYLRHRPAERLMYAREPLTQVLERLEQAEELPDYATEASTETATYGVKDGLPSFSKARIARMDFPLAYNHAGLPFAEWREKARAIYIELLQTPPPRAPFEPLVLAVEKREGYEARKLAFNISTDERIAAYLLVPDGEGPFPAILALHDHGAHFTIGKEKVIRPFPDEQEKLKDALEWTGKYYGGQFIGDELAKRGYVVFATDALFWGDRGRYEGPEHSRQQELGANMLQLGQSWAGVITWDDIRSGEFLQGLPEVLPERIGCIGLSMGAHRTWNLCAVTDIMKAGAAICWLGDTPTLMAAGNNQTSGQSAFSMIHPGLRSLLDYPHVASIACPKPMLFFNGTEDALFPVPGVEASFAILRDVYESQGVADRLYTRLWPAPHEFNLEMQAEAFAWLDKQLAR